MSEHTKVAATENVDTLTPVLGFWKKNQKNITVALAVIVVVLGGYIGYKELISKPNEEKAAELIYKAQQYFAQDSSKLVLDGDGTNKGVLYVISNYGSTKAGKLAHFYAGISYLKLGEFAKATEQLKAFKTDAKQIQMVAYGALADAYAEQGKKEDAIEFYKKAGAEFEKDENNAAEYLFRAALLSETTGKSKEALEIYKSIKSKFPKTDKGIQADKYIYRLSVEPNELSVK